MGYYDDCLEHHGILGQKWGVRRFESASGHLTAAGKNRYNQIKGEYQKLKKKVMSNKVDSTGEKKKEGPDDGEQKKGLTDKQKKMIIAGAAVVGTTIAAYGGYKLYQKSVQTRAQAHLLATGMSTVNKEIAKESQTKLNAINDYYHAVSNNGHTKDGGLLVNPKAYKDHWTGVADRHIGELNNQYEELRKNAANIGSDYKKSKAYLNSVKNRTNKHEDFIDVSNRARAISSMGKPKKQTQTSAKAVSNARSALKEFQSLQSNPNKPTVSKSAQNTSQIKSQMTEQKMQAAQRAVSSGSKAVQSTIKVSGQTKFNQAAKANDDFVNDLLKKNASMLAGF